MKNIKEHTNKNYLYYVLLLTIMSLGLTSCEDDKKNNLDIFEKSGGFVRFSNPFPAVVNISNLDEIAGLSIETTIESPNNNVVSYTIEISATIGGVSTDFVSFGSEITSFPATINITASEITNALGIEVSDIGFGDTFAFKGTAVNDQGTIYSSERIGFDSETNTVTGGSNTNDLLDEDGYRNAYEFGFAIPCPAESGNIAGNWIIDMIDLYGDGWDNAFVTFAIDGVPTTYGMSGGSAITHTITVPSGAQNLVISYTSGSFEEEHVYTVEKPDGTVLGPFGPNPPLCIN